MPKENTIDPNDLKKRDVFQYENKYHSASVVKVIDDRSTEKAFDVTVEVLDSIFGNFEEGDTFKISFMKNESSPYIRQKMKRVGSSADYHHTRDGQVENLKEKYEEDPPIEDFRKIHVVE